MLEAILINGLVIGGVYSMLAIGFSLVFGVARIMNLAHTAFYMVSTFLIFVLTKMAGFSPLISLSLAVPAIGILGVLCYKLCFDRVKGQETAIMIISLALAMLLQEILLLIFEADLRSIPPFVPGLVEIARVKIMFQDLFVIAISFVTMIGVWLLLSKTTLGNAIRAVSEDKEVANLMGIDVSRICLMTMAISSMLAGIAGGVSNPMVEPFMWLHPLTIVLAAVLLGGLGSVKGSVIGAYILGFVESALVFLIPGGSFLKGSVSLSTMVIVLLIRPEGLYGIIFEEERL
jgi:branched-chain amino acid transport system permease protein